MAFFSNIDNTSNLFREAEAYNILYSYMLEVCKDSSLQRRILSLKCEGERIEKRYNLGFGMTAIEQSYKLGKKIKFESHRKYIDFQLVIKGREYMLVGDWKDFEAINDYNEANDVIFYKPNKQVSRLLLSPKILAILLPYDIHAGGIIVNNDENIIYKSVIKVPYSLLNPSILGESLGL